MIRSSRALALFLGATFAYGTVTPQVFGQAPTPPSGTGDYRGKANKPTSTGANGGTSENSAKARRNYVSVRVARSRATTGGGNNQQNGNGSGTGTSGSGSGNGSGSGSGNGGGGSGTGTGTSGGGLGSPSLPPTGLAADAVHDGVRVQLAWTDNSTAETGFEVLRQTLSGGTWGAQVSLAAGANVTSLVDAPGVGTYQYSVRALDALGGSAFTGWMQVTVDEVPPAMPTGLMAADLGNGRDASIAWTDASTNETGFEVERQRLSGGAWVADATLTAGAGATSLVDSPGVGSFRYRVRAVNSAGASTFSDWVSPTIADIAPTAPSGLAAVDLGNRSQVRLTWSDASGNESGFEAVREALSGSTWGSATTITASANATQVVDAPGLGTYRYKLRAVNGVGASAYTSTVQVTVAEIAPAPPSAITTTDLGNGSQARVAWSDNSNNEAGFTVIRETQSGSSWINAVTTTTTANATSYVDAPGVGTFRYRVRATNSAGSSAYTGWTQVTVAATTPPPPSAPSSLAVVDNGDGTGTLTWSDNSSNETGFELERSPTFASQAIVGSNVTTYIDAPGAGTYMYHVRALGAGGNSLYTANLATGALTSIGTIGGPLDVESIAVVPSPGALALCGVSGLLSLRRRR